MVLGIICFIFAVAGIIGFYNDLYILTYIGFGLSIFECLLGRFEGTSKTMLTTVIAGIIGWIFVKDFWLGLAIGVCFENAIMFIGGCIMIGIGSSITSNTLPNDNYTNQKNEDTITIMEETINNAKKDLESGIKKEELDKMLENGSITEEKYNEILQSIKTLEMLSNFDINKLKENDKSTKN